MHFITDIKEFSEFMGQVIRAGGSTLPRLSKQFSGTFFWNSTGHEDPMFPTIYFSIPLFEQWQKI